MSTLVTRLPLRPALRLDVPAALAALLGTLLVALVAGANGGYSPTSWGWISLALAWAAILALVLGADVSFGPLEAIAVAAFAALVLWSLASIAWSGDAAATLLSTERLLVYATAFAAVAVLLRAQSYGALIAGVWAGATLVCGYGVLTRMYPDRLLGEAAIAGRRLAQPVGYWNSLGLLAAVGIIVAVGLVSGTRSRVLGAAAAASLVPLSLALYFTFSRGALIALAVGAAVTFALDPSRLRFALAAAMTMAAPAFTVLEASHLSALSKLGATAAKTASDGSKLMQVSLIAAAVAAVAGALLVEAGRRMDVPRAARVAFAVLLAIAVLGTLAVVSLKYGSPSSIAMRAWHSFTAKPPKHTRGDLNDRLLSLSNNGRVALWRVAWHDFAAHPLDGSGAGTYYTVWVQNRTDGTQVRNAHSLYLETLAELGAPGLILLAVGLLTPLAAAVRSRKRVLVAVAVGAYVAFLLHAAFDWDWQLPGVVLAPLLLGAALLAAARPSWSALGGGNRARLAIGVAFALVVACSAFTLAGNRALSSARNASGAEHWPAAESRARHAASLQPWSAAPWQVLGEAQVQQGKLAAARTSFRRGLAKNPHDWRLWLDLALASPRKARTAAAKRALALNPHSTEMNRILPFLGLKL